MASLQAARPLGLATHQLPQPGLGDWRTSVRRLPTLRDSHIALRQWLARQATSAQRRVLRSLFASPVAMSKRTLQQRLHRVAAATLNPAIDSLVSAGLVTRTSTLLDLPPAVRANLATLGFGVSLARPARALTRERETRQETSGSRGVKRVTARSASRPLPPKGTPAWGRSMLARRGGLACQRAYRTRGVHPTAKATAARLEKRPDLR